MRIWLFCVVACGNEPASMPDAALDAAPPDVLVPDAPLRKAVIGDCMTVTGPHGLTAEVTNDMGYVPSVDVTIKVGTVARFAYADGGTEHAIVSGSPGMPDGLFASAPFSDHGAFTCIRFETPGTYPIHCDRHPAGKERGTITVTP